MTDTDVHVYPTLITSTSRNSLLDKEKRRKLAAKLRSQRGEWAVTRYFPTQSQARKGAEAINADRSAAFPAIDYQAEFVQRDTRWAVIVRYLGDFDD